MVRRVVGKKKKSIAECVDRGIPPVELLCSPDGVAWGAVPAWKSHSKYY